MSAAARGRDRSPAMSPPESKEARLKARLLRGPPLGELSVGLSLLALLLKPLAGLARALLQLFL